MLAKISKPVLDALNYHYKIDWTVKTPIGKSFGTYYI